MSNVFDQFIEAAPNGIGARANVFDQFQNANAVYDLPLSAAMGLVQGATNLAGLPGDIQSGAEWLAHTITPASTKLPSQPLQAPRSQDIRSAIEQWTGPFYEPKTTAGKFAHSAMEMVPGAVLGPGGATRNAVAYGVVPGLMGELGARTAAAGGYGDTGQTVARIGASGAAGLAALPAARAFGNKVSASSTARGIERSLAAAGDDTSINSAAVNKMARNIIDDRLTPHQVQSRASELGPEAMLMDMSPQLSGRAEALATQPGRGQSKLVSAVEARTGEWGAKTAERVKNTLDSLMGSSPDMVSYVRNAQAIVDQYARPAYQRVMSAYPVIWDARIEELMQRPAIQSAFRDARTVALNYGEDIGGRPSLAAWDYTKKALDARINGYMRNGMDALNSQDKADLGGLRDARKALVSHLDNVTNGEYAAARRISATKQSMQESVDIGREAFNTKILPEELMDQLRGMSVVDRSMAEAGMRRELERLIDVARNDGAAARRILDSNQNLQKIEAVFGRHVADGIERRISNENVFQERTTRLTGNSRTAVRRELAADTADPTIGQALQTTLPGLAVAGGRAGLNYLMANGMSKTREGAAAMLGTSGQTMNDVSDALIRYSQRVSAQSTPERMNRARLILNSIISGKE